jgi:hypothetical protein
MEETYDMAGEKMNEEDFVVGHLKEKWEELKSFISDGKCKDYADYQNLCGQIRGLRYSLQRIEELKEKLKEEEDKGE